MSENNLDSNITKKIVIRSYSCYNKKLSGATKTSLTNEMVKYVKELVNGEQNDN